MQKRLGIAILPLMALVLLFLPAGSSAASNCDLYASPTGSDSGSGAVSSPFGSAQTLVDRLAPGQVGCLRAGTYGGDSEEVKVSQPGITLQSAPGEVATIAARFWIAKGADGVTVENLYLQGANSRAIPSPTVNAANAVFRHVDVTNNHTAICFDLGNSEWGQASGTLIEESRVHDCGELPATNQDHGIYLSDAVNTTIKSNWIYDNADRGIQLFPNAQNTTIVGNVINANGVGIIFSGDESVAANDSHVSGNVISNSNQRHNVESFYYPGGPHGVDNVVQHNCIHGADGWYAGPNDSGVEETQDGFSASNNVNEDPRFVNAAAGDLRMYAGSPCAAVMPRTADGLVPGVISGISDKPIPTATADGKGSVIIKVADHRAAPGSRVFLKGRTKGARRAGASARIYARSGHHHWRRVGVAPLRSRGTFFVRAKLAVPAGVVCLKASVPGLGGSRPVKVRVG